MVAMSYNPTEIDVDQLRTWKSHGFDSHIADALNAFPASGYKSLPRGRDEDSVMRRRHSLSLHPNYRMVDSCAAEFAAKTPYYYSTYEPSSGTGIDHIPNLEKRTKERYVAI